MLTEDRVILKISMAVNFDLSEVIEGFAKTQNSQPQFQQYKKKCWYDDDSNEYKNYSLRKRHRLVLLKLQRSKSRSAAGSITIALDEFTMFGQLAHQLLDVSLQSLQE